MVGGWVHPPHPPLKAPLFFALTLKPLELLVEAALRVLLEAAQRGRLQHLEVDLDLVRVGLAHGGLQRLDDLHHAAQLLARQPVDVQAQPVLLLVAQRNALVLGVPRFQLLAGIPGIPRGTRQRFRISGARNPRPRKPPFPPAPCPPPSYPESGVGLPPFGPSTLSWSSFFFLRTSETAAGG